MWATADTQNQPISGITNWNPANTPAIPHILAPFISGSLRPLASETEKASIARPTPSITPVMKNDTVRFISIPPLV